MSPRVRPITLVTNAGAAVRSRVEVDGSFVLMFIGSGRRAVEHRPRPDEATALSGGGRLAGLDGLRALAVASVMAFHFGLGWFSGGFLGVDVFYVLSGFLITLLLLHELERRQSVRLGAFWARRARRLLPCLVLVVVAVTFYVADVAPAGSYPGFRMDALSALFYFSNWHQIAASSNYFASTGPSRRSPTPGRWRSKSSSISCGRSWS